MKPIWRCTRCIKDSPEPVCDKCGNECVDSTQPHHAHWSRKTIRTVECKICDRAVTYEQMGTDNDCPGRKGQV